MAYETITTIANAAARPSPSDGMIRYQQDIQSCIVYDSGASAWKVFTPDAAPYDLDGTNIMTVTPDFHFDATRIDGSSTAADDNPVNAQIFDGTVDSDNPTGGIWTSRSNSVSTTAQGTGSLQPTYYTSGVNSKPYFATALDYLPIDQYNKEVYLASGAFTAFGVFDQTSGSYNTGMGGSSNDKVDALWMNYTNGDDYLYWDATGKDNDNAPTMASASGNGSTAEADTDVLRMYLIIRDSSNNTKIYWDGDNSTAGLTATFTGPIIWSYLIASGTNASYHATGNYYECAFWKSDLATADRNKLITYVNTKYGTGRNADDTDALARVTF